MTYNEKLLADMDEGMARMKRQIGFITKAAIAARAKLAAKVEAGE